MKDGEDDDLVSFEQEEDEIRETPHDRMTHLLVHKLKGMWLRLNLRKHLGDGRQKPLAENCAALGFIPLTRSSQITRYACAEL